MDMHESTASLKEFAADAVVAFAYSDRPLSGGAAELDAAARGAFSRFLGRPAFKAELGDVVALPLDGPAEVGILAGLGAHAECDADALRRAARLAGRKALEMGLAHVGVAAADDAPGGDGAAREAALIGLSAGAYRFHTYKSEPGPAVERVTLLSAGGPQDPSLRRAAAVADGVRICRELIDTPPNDKTPDLLAERVTGLARAAGLECEVLGADRLAEMGAGGILAVGRGSAHPPALVVLRHDGGRGPWHAFVGKGMTFDSGGLDLKSQDGMLTMKSDMSGAAAVVGAMHAIARLGLEGRFLGVLGLAENMPGTGAYRPSDVLRMLGGATVEVSNTDAEGRLVLADGLSYVCSQGAKDVIDLATLTGAIVVALGTHRAGLFANEDALAESVLSAGGAAGERYWRMPLDREHKEALKSPVADTKSTGGRPGGSATAAAFLARFAGTTPWAHLDIAGTAFRDAKGPYGEGATGFGVETLVRFAAGA